MVTIATDARRVVRALPTPRAPEADASRGLIRRRTPRRPAFAAVAPRVRARLRVAPASRPQNRPQGGALCFRESIFDFTAHRLTRLSPVAPQKRDAMNEPVPSVPRKARTGTALDGIERGTQTSALPARGFPSLARFPAKRRSAAFSPSRIAPRPDFRGGFRRSTPPASSVEDFVSPSENADVCVFSLLFPSAPRRDVLTSSDPFASPAFHPRVSSAQS